MAFFGALGSWSRFSDFRPSTLRSTVWAVILVCLLITLPVSVQGQEIKVALAQFTTAIEDREPIDQVTFVQNDVRKVFFYSDLHGMTGQTIRHRWLHGGAIMADVSFEVRGPRWRVWSSKELLPDWIGDWTVEIVNAEGEVIAAETFTYTAPGA